MLLTKQAFYVNDTMTGEDFQVGQIGSSYIPDMDHNFRYQQLNLEEQVDYHYLQQGLLISNYSHLSF